MKKLLALLALSGMLLSGCGGGGSAGTAVEVPTGNSSTAAAASVLPAGAECSNGGIQLESGIDDNANGILDPGEVDDVSYICNGTDGADGIDGVSGINGNDGLNALISVTAEPAGTNCANGGQKIAVGIDSSSDGVLDLSEIDDTSYVCDGGGTNGVDGTDGLISLVLVSDENPGTNCATGGKKVESGLDVNIDGILETSEVTDRNYVCNGVNGLDGGDGLSALISMTAELAGVNCANGGQKIEVGIDSSADGILDLAEITDTSYVCTGDAGTIGDTGPAGADGLSSLISFAVEGLGENCSNGGYKVNSGLDYNRNYLLDSWEVSATEYLCNAPIISLEKGLVSHYRFDDYLKDELSYDNDAISSISTEYYTEGIAGQAYSFLGTYVPHAVSLPLRISYDSSTISFWLRSRENTLTYKSVLQMNDDGTGVKGIFVINNMDEIRLQVSTEYDDVFPLTTDEWHLITIVDNSGTTQFYIDGVSQGETPTNQDPSRAASTNNYVNLGGVPGFGAYWNGDIDDFRIYNRALSSAEVGAIYRSLK